jgi:hypothetical protein
MTLRHRFLRRLGHDTTVTITHEEPRYEYTVAHLNGDVTTETANRHTRDEGFLLLQNKDDDTWARATFHLINSYTGPPAFSMYRGYDTVRELEGVQEVERERIGTDIWEFTVDRADGDLLDTQRRYHDDW